MLFSDVNSCCFDSIFGILIEDIVELLGIIRDGICRHISYKGNMVAHTLVVLGLRSFGCLVWDINLYDVLQDDLS